jgi:hypothetical protein
MNAILVTIRHMKMYKNLSTMIISNLHISYACVLNVILIIITDIFKFCINEICCTSEEQPLSHKQYARTVFKNLGFGFHHPTPIQEIWKALTAVFCFTVRPE